MLCGSGLAQNYIPYYIVTYYASIKKQSEETTFRFKFIRSGARIEMGIQLAQKEKPCPEMPKMAHKVFERKK